MKNILPKKLTLRSFVAIIMVLAMLFSITACDSKKKPSGNESSKPNSSNSSNPSGNSSTPSVDDINQTTSDNPDVPASKSEYPAPQMVENPQFLKEFTKPSAVISTAAFSDNFSVEFTGTAATDGPQIGSVTEQAGPNDSISIYGQGFDKAKVFAYGLVKGVGTTKQLEVTSQRSDFVNAIIPADFDYGMYIIWIQGSNGKFGAPVRVNAPKLTHASAAKASENAEVRIYGRFLTTNNADGKDAKSFVYLINGEKRYAAKVVEATPYRVTVKLPTGLTDGQKYKILVHNGHGGSYGWSNPVEIEYKKDAENFFTGKKHTVKVTNGMSSDEEISAAINNAAAGDTIYLPAGTYVINDQIKLRKSVKLEGEAKDKVIFVCVFSQRKSSNSSLMYGDVYSNLTSGPTAAFEVLVSPIEFKGITFTSYAEGAEYCEKVPKPSSYDIDYAHGMFIRGQDTNDTGVAGQLKIDNCNFKVPRTHSDADCAFYGASEQERLHKEYEKKYEFYSRTNIASTPLWIATDRTEISNCYFETPKEIFTDIMRDGYIHDNTFVGTWVIAGNSGPAAIHNNDSVNMDISNNRIYGKDEVTDKNGYVKTGDQTYARTIVFQKSWDEGKNIYVLNNDVSRVGELNYNSGEHILFEEVGVTYVGKVNLSNNNMTLTLKDAHLDKWKSNTTFAGFITGNDGNIKLGHTRPIKGQLVIITKGKGQGQWRTIVSSKKGEVTIDRAWEIQPDETCTFVVVPAFANCTVYGNKIEGPKMYYKNYNSTNGVNAYATMVSTVIDRNNFSQMQAGVAINPQYNSKSYTYDGKKVKVDYNFILYTEMLVMNNTITDTRYGIWNFPSFTMSGSDISTLSPDTYLQMGTIFRGNTLNNQRRLTSGADTNSTVNTQLIKRGGVGIVVGRDYWDASSQISTRAWMNDTVVENNKINKPANGYIDLSYSQSNTIIRNNVYDGKQDLTFDKVNITHNPHNSGRKINAPAYFK